MSTASSHSPTELKAGKEGRGLSASVMDELSVLAGGGETLGFITSTLTRESVSQSVGVGGPHLRASVEEPMPSGERMLLLRAEWIWLKVGRSVRSFCQQSSIS